MHSLLLCGWLSIVFPSRFHRVRTRTLLFRDIFLVPLTYAVTRGKLAEKAGNTFAIHGHGFDKVRSDAENEKQRKKHLSHCLCMLYYGTQQVFHSCSKETYAHNAWFIPTNTTTCTFLLLLLLVYALTFSLYLYSISPRHSPFRCGANYVMAKAALKKRIRIAEMVEWAGQPGRNKPTRRNYIL